MTTATEKKSALRDKRAQGIAAMGLVNREGDRFRVTTPSLRGRRASYEVWRDETGKVRCSCLEFEEQSSEDTAFRCEHILAVKHSVLAKQTEAVTAQAPMPSLSPDISSHPAEPEPKQAIEVHPPSTNEIASEKRSFANHMEVKRRFEREKKTAREADTTYETREMRVSAARSLAKHINDKEQEMKTEKIAATATGAVTMQPQHDEIINESGEGSCETRILTTASIVPLAFTNTLRTLRQPVDPKLVKTREGWRDRQGNTHLVEYVEWHTVADILDRVTPTWSHSVRNITQIGDMVAVTAAITIDGVTREGVGTGTADNETGIKKAEHDALKRASIKFGIARDLYQRESEMVERQGAVMVEGEVPEKDTSFRDPVARSIGNLVTPKQLGMIRALAREAGVDAEEECQNLLTCRTEELSKRAASALIDHLKSMQQETAAGAGNSMRRAS